MKAIVWIDKTILQTRDQLERAEFHARRRAGELGVSVVKTMWRIQSMADPMEELHRALHAADAPMVITPTLEHVGGTIDLVTEFAELATVDPPRVWPWSTPLTRSIRRSLRGTR
ncbi:hypothetical protein [Nocardia acidivorans]|uniref:hypothetical protein n=1 Tax=Nocardia acidivorans TaxID=404580 RepID=UPI000833A699|nr:hypothetical protein [Nocardia acidivorans]